MTFSRQGSIPNPHLKPEKSTKGYRHAISRMWIGFLTKTGAVDVIRYFGKDFHTGISERKELRDSRPNVIDTTNTFLAKDEYEAHDVASCRLISRHPEFIEPEQEFAQVGL